MKEEPSEMGHAWPVELKFRKLVPDAVQPRQMTSGVEMGHAWSAGLDLTAISVNKMGPFFFFLHTGLEVEPEEGFYCEIAPRSSLPQLGFFMPNSFGIIDADYRGELMIQLWWIRSQSYVEAQVAADSLIGTRVAQLLVRPLYEIKTKMVKKLSETKRGSGGFGSTGR